MQARYTILILVNTEMVGVTNMSQLASATANRRFVIDYVTAYCTHLLEHLDNYRSLWKFDELIASELTETVPSGKLVDRLTLDSVRALTTEKDLSKVVESLVRINRSVESVLNSRDPWVKFHVNFPLLRNALAGNRTVLVVTLTDSGFPRLGKFQPISVTFEYEQLFQTANVYLDLLADAVQGADLPPTYGMPVTAKSADGTEIEMTLNHRQVQDVIYSPKYLNAFLERMFADVAAAYPASDTGDTEAEEPFLTITCAPYVYEMDTAEISPIVVTSFICKHCRQLAMNARKSGAPLVDKRVPLRAKLENLLSEVQGL